ncbi:MFS transporter [Synechococcus elongatus]|uniref:MFS transporter n=1 Tax=Synechococcus elongatus PCC 11802 TaxID=2283154 RepID=A0AAU6R5L1_SYNEL|nr:MFS transporter [Synechococcus elongatus]QFZ90986.1 MFS transporter [Synechococcus elongatus PCC 11802]
MIPQLDLRTKLSFGVGDFGTAVMANLQVFFLLFFLTTVAGLDAAWAGSILMIGKVWDAVNDPLIGWLSDRTNSRNWGRRYPWMIWAAIPLGLTFYLQWIVPTQNPTWLFIFYVVVALLFNSFYTAVNLPYTALTPELTQDYDDRTKLNSFRFSFSIGGSILSLLLAQAIFSLIPNPQEQYQWLGAIAAIASVLPIFICVWGTRRRYQFMRPLVETTLPPRQSIAEELQVVKGNKPFLFVIGLYLCSWLAVQATASVIPYFVRYWMRLPDTDLTSVMLAVQGTALLTLFGWSWLSNRIGKQAVYYWGTGLWLIAQVGLFILQPNQVGLMYVMAILAGCGVSVAYLIPWSMLPDVIEWDELQTGQRREGIYYGFMVFLQKLALALGLFVVGQALSWAGLIPGDSTVVQPDSALWAIRIAIAPFPTICLILGLLCAKGYPITRDRHEAMLLQLAERRAKV